MNSECYPHTSNVVFMNPFYWNKLMDLFAWKIGADIFCLMMFLIALWESLNSSALDLCENISDREVVESSCLIEFVEDFMKMI